MESTPVVLEISSDEEEEEKSSSVGLRTDDYDWIREFLGMSDDDDGKSDDSDDVVIIHENKPQPRPKSSTRTVVAVKDVDDGGGGGGGDDDDDDDDCMVLDGDPENGGVTCVGGDDDEANGSDELLVVGEKGQVACRDYPHARHVCAKFPFTSTPPSSHCDQCHCYVCDSLAPCLMWGSGLLSSDHCNANDKIEIWRIQRNNFKMGNSSPLPASNKHGTSLPAGHRQCNGIPPLDIIHLPPDSMLRNQASRSTAMHTSPSLNSIPQNQSSRPTGMFAISPSLNSGLHNQLPRPNNCPVDSAASNLTIPNGANHVRSQQTGGSTLVRNRNQSHLVARQWLGVRRHGIPTERGNGASNLGPQLLRSHTIPNRSASAGDTITVNHSGHVSSGFSNHVNPAQQIDKYHTATGFSNDRNHNNPNQVWHPGNLPMYRNQGSETQAYVQPLSQSNNSHDSYQSCIQGPNYPPSSFVACLDGNQHGNEQQIGNQNENAGGNITQYGITGQETNQPKPQDSAVDSSWTENSCQGVEPLVACSRPQGSGSTNHPPNVNDIEAGIQIAAAGSTGTLTESPHVPSSLIDFENWLLEKDLFGRVSDGTLPSELDIPYPECAPVDSGMLLPEWW